MPMTPNATALDNELLKVSLSPIAALLDDPHVTDIMVYGSQHVYSRGRRSGFERVPVSWLSDEDLMTAAKTIGRQMNRRLDHREPILDARLPDKSRVNVIIDPCYHRGACIAIRKFSRDRFTWDELVGFGSIDRAGVAILEAVLRLGKNILISGGARTRQKTKLHLLARVLPGRDNGGTLGNARGIALHDGVLGGPGSKRGR